MNSDRIDFSNGWSIDIHEEIDGWIYYQRWPPGVERQGMFDNLCRMEFDKFYKAVREVN